MLQSTRTRNERHAGEDEITEIAAPITAYCRRLWQERRKCDRRDRMHWRHFHANCPPSFRSRRTSLYSVRDIPVPYHIDDESIADSCRIPAHAAGDLQPWRTLHTTGWCVCFRQTQLTRAVLLNRRFTRQAFAGQRGERGRTLLVLLKTVAAKNSAPGVKLTCRNRYQRTAKRGGTTPFSRCRYFIH